MCIIYGTAQLQDLVTDAVYLQHVSETIAIAKVSHSTASFAIIIKSVQERGLRELALAFQDLSSAFHLPPVCIQDYYDCPSIMFHEGELIVQVDSVKGQRYDS